MNEPMNSPPSTKQSSKGNLTFSGEGGCWTAKRKNAGFLSASQYVIQLTLTP